MNSRLFQNRYSIRIVVLLIFVALIMTIVPLHGPIRFIDILRRRVRPRKTYTVPVETLISDPVTDDTLSKYQWALRAMLDGATYQEVQGDAPRDVIVAVIDHRWGPLDHPDLVEKVVDGWSFIGNQVHPHQEYDGKSPGSSIAHGQCVSSIIAAEANNGIGLAGVCSRAFVMPIQTRLDHMADAILFAVDHGVDVIHIGGGFSSNGNRWPAYLWPALGQNNLRPAADLYQSDHLRLMREIKAAIGKAYEANIAIVTAVGNSGQFTLGFVADDARVIAVGGHNVMGQISDQIGFSYAHEIFAPAGSWRQLTNVQEISARFPLADGLSVFTFYGDYDDPICAVGSAGYSFITLNSAAVPHVAGAIAIIKSYLPDSNVEDVRAILHRSQIPLRPSASLMEGVAGRLSLRKMKEEIDRRLNLPTEAR